MSNNSSKYVTRDGKTSKRGAFLNGIWHCDCDPRKPADKFQTKKANSNYGRWFYTCQKAQHKSCNFFLWSDEAKVREESAVLSNSRSEPLAAPQTPRKPFAQNVIPTPDTKPRPLSSRQVSPQQPLEVKDEEDFGWSSDADDEIVEALEVYETPRKAPRTAQNTSPGKHLQSFQSTRTANSNPAPTVGDDVFTTPSTSHTTSTIGLLSPNNTPSRQHSQPLFQHGTDSHLDSSLTSQALSLLSSLPHPLPPTTISSLTNLLQNHELRTAGIAKGRDISRLAVQAKDRKIADLQARIQVLEGERETSRAVIGCLKSDIASSPARKGGGDGGGRRRGGGQGRKEEGVLRRRSEV